MGLGDIFKKEGRLLDDPKELPELASEKLGDEKAAAPPRREYIPHPNPVPEAVKAEIPKREETKLEVPMPQQNAVQPQNPTSMNFSYPNFYPSALPMMQMPMNYPVHPMHVNQMPQVMPQNISSNQMSGHMNSNFNVNREEIKKTHRTPLRNLLTELDEMEERWHSLTYQKRSVEKELKYLEAEIEHKLKLLRTHMVIANEESEVPKGKEFYMADGKVLRSRKDLELAASEMSQQIFDHHVGPGWNDFSSWANNCLKEPELAAKLKTARNSRELLAALKKY